MKMPVASLVLLCVCFAPVSPAEADAPPQDAPALPSQVEALSPTPSLAVIRSALDFTLMNTTGQLVRLSELRGQIVLVSFIYTSCPSACPLLTARMAAMLKRLERDDAARGRVRFLSITVDPARDSAALLEQYARRFKVDFGVWKFLREEPQKLRSVLTAYDEWTRPQPDGEIDHPARLYLIDPQGRIREIYSLSFFDERQPFLDIKALLRESR